VSQPDPFPIVQGAYQVTADWTIALPASFKMRIEDGSLVLWRSGVTAWIIVWKKPPEETKGDRLATLRHGISRAAYDLEEETDEGRLRLSYRLRDEGTDATAAAFYSFVVGEEGHVQMAVYFDAEADVATARALWRGLKETVP
jgi:hypothetical protein